MNIYSLQIIKNIFIVFILNLIPKKTKTRVKKPQNKTCKKFCKKTFLPEKKSRKEI